MPSDQREGKFMRKAYLIGLSILTFSSSAVFAQGAAPIQKLEDSLAEAINKGDAAAAANLYMEDAYFMPPDADPIRGRDAIKAAWEKAIPAGTDLRLTVVDVQYLGNDAAVEIGKFARKLKNPPSKELEGKYVILWRKVGSDWKMSIDIFSRNKPL